MHCTFWINEYLLFLSVCVCVCVWLEEEWNQMASSGKTKWIMTKTFQTTDYANICTIDHTQNVFISHLTLSVSP